MLYYFSLMFLIPWRIRDENRVYLYRLYTKWWTMNVVIVNVRYEIFRCALLRAEWLAKNNVVITAIKDINAYWQAYQGSIFLKDMPNTCINGWVINVLNEHRKIRYDGNCHLKININNFCLHLFLRDSAYFFSTRILSVTCSL